MEVTSLRVIVLGRVQGLWYRKHTREQVEALGLTGGVRNKQGGSVEIEVERPMEKINELAEWCRKGPPRARPVSL